MRHHSSPNGCKLSCPICYPKNEKPTPGPWIQVPRETGEIHIQGADGVNLALVTVADYKRQDANAHIIAAAPELYHALERMLDAYDIGQESRTGAIAVAREVMRKLKGKVSL